MAKNKETKNAQFGQNGTFPEKYSALSLFLPLWTSEKTNERTDGITDGLDFIESLSASRGSSTILEVLMGNF